ncbi:MAG: glycine cleavage system protein GcvH [Synergistaceae bacterium]|nr:glycine cleavage system protein GcvH [Synergistaceae bacterium]
MNVPDNLLYTKSHEWIKILEGGNALVGITDYAQEQLSDVVFVSLCGEGEKLSANGTIGDVESIKAVSEIKSPVDGTVVRVNQGVMDDPALINSAPYDAWLVELSGVKGEDSLLSAKAYEELIGDEA